MSGSDTPICDLIERLMSRGLSPGDAVAEARPVEASTARGGVSTAERRERERLKKQRQRDRKRGHVPGTPSLHILTTSESKTHSELKKKESKNPVSPMSPGDKLNDWPSDNEKQFWSNYPRKVEKKAAMAALDRVRRSGVVWAVFLAGLMRYAEKARRMETKFIKHPTTWLNKGCWDDEPDDHGGGPNGPGHHNAQPKYDPVTAAAARHFGGGGRNGAASRTADSVSPADRMGDERPGAKGGGQPAFDLDLKPGPDGVFRR